jgi:sec-independent protein translocase protein TatB
MEFFNIGGGELLVIVLLALILFGPEDIMKMMRTLGKYARSAREMWTQFNATLQDEYLDSEELGEVLEETKATVAEAQEAVRALNVSMKEVTSAVEKDVAAAQQTVHQEGKEAAAALKETLQPQGKVQAGMPDSSKPSEGAASPTTLPEDESATDEAADDAVGDVDAGAAEADGLTRSEED